jgi:hypothetical protein
LVTLRPEYFVMIILTSVIVTGMHFVLQNPSKLKISRVQIW